MRRGHAFTTKRTSSMSLFAATAVAALALGGGAGSARADFALVENGGFEVNDTGLFLPLDCGYWSGDRHELTIGNEEDGIIPFEGVQMLHFQDALPTGPSGGSIGCELWQMIDMTEFQDEINSGEWFISAEGYFNRIAGDAETDTQFSILVTAYSGDPSSFTGQWGSGELVYSEGFVFTDDDIETWERAVTTTMLPVGTDFIVVRVTSTEEVMNDAEFPEFDGHYADAITVTFTQIPAPGAASLLALGGLIGFGSRRRRSA